MVGGLLGCADYGASEAGLQDAPIQIQSEIVQQYTTRANDNGFADGDKIGVFIVDYQGGQPQPLQPSGNRASNVAFTFDGASGLWSSNQTLYWRDQQTAVDAYSYYPYNSALSSVGEYPVIVQQRQDKEMDGLTGYEQSDFLWAKAEGVTPGMPIRLKHQHVMAGIRVTLVEGTGFADGEWSRLEKSVLVENTRVSTTVNLTTGEVTLLPSHQGEGAGVGATSAITPMSQGDSYRAIVAPQTLAAGTTLLTITVDGITYRHTRTEPTVYHPGRLHNFAISVNRREATGDYEFQLLTESVTQWENDPVSHNGEAKEYIVVSIREDQYLGDVISEMGLDPEKIVNLKLVGEMSARDEWSEDEASVDRGTNFHYLRNKLPRLEALNMKELRLKGAAVDELYFVKQWERAAELGHDDILPYRALYGVKTLCSVVFPDHLKAICELAFQGTNLRTSCILPEGLVYIGMMAFGSDLDEARNGDGRYIEMDHGCHMTGDLYIPSTCQYIGANAFARQDFSCELVLPERMDYLGAGAFYDCKYMTGYLHIPEGLTEVNAAWTGMAQLKGFAEIPDGVTTIGGIGCPATALHVPEGVTSIGNNTKLCGEYNDQLKDVYLPTTLKTLAWDLFRESGISHIQLPDGLETIPRECFRECANLQDTLYLPSSLVSIEFGAFEACAKLQAVVLPENLGNVGSAAFMRCVSLDYIQCLSETPPLLEYLAFEGVNKSNVTVVVPEGTVDTYRNAEGWSEFKRITSYKNFVCRPMQDKLLNKGHVMEVVLNADGNWTMTHCPAWAHVDKTSGFKKTELKVTVDDLPHGAPNRQDSIVFTLSDKTDEDGNAITCYYKLQQYDYEHDEDSELRLGQATRGNGKVNIFICGDGYDAEDIAKGTYLNDMKREMEYFFGVEPYTTYKDYFNVYTGFALSRESGINSTNKWRDTKFETYHGKSKKDVRITTNFDAAMLYALEVSPQIVPDGASAPLVILVANTGIYDGVTAMFGDGSAVALCPLSTEDYPFDARGIIQHEAGGHGFGKLADEYIYHMTYIQTCSCKDGCEHVDGLTAMKNLGWARNVSLNGKYSNAEWRQLIFDPHYSDIVDIYDGAFFHGRGVYRSEVNSCMNNNVAYFSTVSRMAIVERIKQQAGEPFCYDDFVANDSRAVGDKFITRGTAPQGVGHGMHLSAPIIVKGSPLDLMKKGGKR